MDCRKGNQKDDSKQEGLVQFENNHNENTIV